MKRRLMSVLLVLAMTAGLAAGCSTNTTSNGVQGTEGAKGTENSVTEVYHAVLPTEAEEADIYVEPIEGLSDDFIKGVDISTVIAQEESGVVYYNEAGEEADLFRILADSGVNYIRVRVWNDPYDSDGNGYGGGNNDVAKAAEIGRRAAENGMKLLVDFHYSDFWADPAKQFAPKEWKHMTFADKKQALYDFTKESLETIIAAGADVGMVQIGNEINNGMAGETDYDNVIELLIQGSTAVREVSKEIQIAVHLTNIDDYKQIMNYAAKFEAGGLDYDIFGVSYYAYWHGSMDKLTDVLKDLTANYGKKTAVLETSYAYTEEDGDGFGNSIGAEDSIAEYTASVQSQATCVRDVMAATAAAGKDALGVFYWENAWIPVGSSDNYDANQEIWEKYGSGWASSYAAKYDPNDAGKWYGGSSWDNQAMFDFTGHPLASLNVWKYVNYGTICEPAIDFLVDTEAKVNIGEELVMPDTVYAIYNNRALSQGIPVTWDESQLSAIDTNVSGDYTIDGVLEDGTKVTCALSVANVNWLVNSSFEDPDASMWNVSYEGSVNPTDVQKKAADCTTGEYSFHFWDEAEYEFSVEQTVSSLAAGKYTITANIQGGDVGSDAEIYLYAIVNGTTYKSEVTLEGWCNWQSPEIKDIELNGSEDITIGMYVKSAGGGWGTMDDFYLYKQQ